MQLTTKDINPKTGIEYTQLELSVIHEEALSAQISGFQQAIRTLAKEWKRLAYTVAGDLSTPQQRLAGRTIQALTIEFQKQLRDLGYIKLAEEYVTKVYDDELIWSLNTVEYDVGQALLPSLKDGLLKQIKNLDLSAFESIGNRGIQELSKQLTMDAVIGVPRKQMLEAIDKTLDQSFQIPATLYVDTATRAASRLISMETWDEAGIDTFEYFGPSDTKTRPFCAEHVGKTYTKAEILKMDNGQSLPVIIYGGGWRCRHSFSPVQANVDSYVGRKKRTPKEKTPKPIQGNLF